MRIADTATTIALTAALAAASSFGASDLGAQDRAADTAQRTGTSAWLALAGCWVEVDAPVDAPMICVVPETGAEAGAELLTISGTQLLDRQRLTGTGVDQPVDAGGCRGVEAAELSRDGDRLYTRSRVSCDGGTERSTRGLIAMVSPAEWIRVRAITVGEGSASWVTRYRPAPTSRIAAAGLPELTELTQLTRASGERGRAIEMARIVASGAPTVDDIIEAHARTDAEAVRAWIAEQGERIALDADGLIRMADAGVSEAVIDVAVAVSFPERFVLAHQPGDELDPRNRRDRRAGGDRWDSRDRWDRCGYGYGVRGMDPFFYGYDLYSRYDYARCGYSRYGYSPYGYRLGGYGYHPPRVIVVIPAGEATEKGRAVPGRGYTRGGSAATPTRPARPSSSVRAGGGYKGSSGSKATAKPSSSKGKAKPKGGGGGV